MKIFGYTIEISRQKQTTPWRATHRHKKGGAYRYLYEGFLESDRSAIVVYDDPDGNVWVRSTHEFFDGRFTPIGAAPQQ